MRKLGPLILAVAATFSIPAPAFADEDFSIPPYEGVYQPQGTDERGLWMQADESERELRDSELIISDPALNDYVRSVFCRTVGEDRCRNVRIYIARVPRFNATMAPNGMMTIWSGLLLRCQSEADLAAILGHEFAHFEKRHGVASYRRRRGASDFLAWSGVATLYTGLATFGDIFVLGGLFQFNRNQEREADIRGLGYMMNSGYRPQSFASVWTRMMDEFDATAVGRSRSSRRYDRAAFFATHPTSRERTEYLTELAGEPQENWVEKVTEYQEAMRTWIPVFLEDQIRLNDFGGTEYLLGQLSEHWGWTADLLHFRGELYRIRGNPRDLVNAAEFYRQSIELDDSRAKAFRGLGLSLMRLRETKDATPALTRYLELNPDAPDSAMVEALIASSQ